VILSLIEIMQPSVAWLTHNLYDFAHKAQFGGSPDSGSSARMILYHIQLHSCRTCFAVSVDLLNLAVATCLSMGLQIIFDFGF